MKRRLGSSFNSDNDTVFYFFFSSRRRHTRFDCDWSSDVCSSDLTMPPLSRETMQRILEMIRHDVAEDKIKIDTPTQNLESYFLDVVQKARQAAAEIGRASCRERV